MAALPKHRLRRDPSLDFLRAFALVVMVGAHFSRGIPADSAAARTFRFFTEAAPAFFFVAFGMTFDFFHRKDPAMKRKNSILFLFVALLHNLWITGRLVTMEFFFFLWMCQTLLSALEGQFPTLAKYWPSVLVAAFFSFLIIPYRKFTHLFNLLVVGDFPLIPWGLFFLMGVVFSRSRERQARWTLVSLALLTSSMLLLWAGRLTHQHNWEFSKWPLSGTYCMAFSALGLMLVLVVERFESIYLSYAPLSRASEFISRNLLLATVLHFAVYDAVQNALGPFWILSSSAGLNAAAMVLGTLISTGVLLVSLRVVNALWARIAHRTALEKCRKHFIPVATFFLLGCVLVSKHIPSHDLFQKGAPLFVVLLYFSLEMSEVRKSHSERQEGTERLHAA